ncbi:hypothetical protein [Oribacterium sp. C9]|uniref:hypothetical protein n=1 Tax=Oribacterium sp. C9 TaxID=1943579 RepID=UPI001439E340|nr:hypothetical protein [Oribacterium sp. C9]
MNKKQQIEKAVQIRSELVLFCGQVPQPIEGEVEDLIPQMDKIIDDINKLVPNKG